MGIKSEKTFEEIVERIVAGFRPQKSSDACDFVACDLEQDRNPRTDPPGVASDASNSDGDGDDLH